jgi:hypothetical protein
MVCSGTKYPAFKFAFAREGREGKKGHTDRQTDRQTERDRQRERERERHRDRERVCV